LKIGYSSNNPIWLKEGDYVFFVLYLFDTSGKKKEVEIVDGNILTIY
jgi:hypothetical protein